MVWHKDGSTILTQDLIRLFDSFTAIVSAVLQFWGYFARLAFQFCLQIKGRTDGEGFFIKDKSNQWRIYSGSAKEEYVRVVWRKTERQITEEIVNEDTNEWQQWSHDWVCWLRNEWNTMWCCTLYNVQTVCYNILVQSVLYVVLYRLFFVQSCDLSHLTSLQRE